MSQNKKVYDEWVYVELRHPLDEKGSFIKDEVCEVCVVTSEGETIYNTPVNYRSTSLITKNTLEYYGKPVEKYLSASGMVHVSRSINKHTNNKFVVGWGKINEKAIFNATSWDTDYTYVDVSEMILKVADIKSYVDLKHVAKAMGLQHEELNKDIEKYLNVIREIHLSTQDRNLLEKFPTLKEDICLNHLAEEASKLGYSLPNM